MRPRDASFTAIFVLVMLAHLGVIAGLLMSFRARQPPAAVAAASATWAEAVSLSLTLADRVSASRASAEINPSSQRTLDNSAAVSDDPPSRLRLPAPKKAESAAKPVPPPVPSPVPERERREVAQREAERTEREREERRMAAEQGAKRKAEEALEREREAAPRLEEERNLALEREAERQRRAEEAKRRRAEALRQSQPAAKRQAEREAAEKVRQLALEQQAEEEAGRAALARDRELAAEASPAVVPLEPKNRPPAVTGKPRGEGNDGAGPALVPAKPMKGSLEGEPAAVDMASYNATVKKMIRQRWSIPIGVRAGEHPQILLPINRGGTVFHPRLKRESGVPELGRSAMEAVGTGLQLMALPRGYEKEVRELMVTFRVDG